MKRFYVGSIVSIIIVIVAAVFGFDLGLGMRTDTLIGTGLVVLWFWVGGINIVSEWNRRPVLRLGKYRGEIGPGFVWLNPAIEWPLYDVSVRDVVFPIKLESVQTKDNVPLSFLLVLTTRVNDVRKSVLEVNGNVWDAVAERAKAAANATIRAHELSGILGEGLAFSEAILASLRDKVLAWGIETKAVEVKDFKIADEDIERAISMRAKAQKEGEAELMRAQMQEQIAKELSKAAKELDEDGWRLKGLEVLLELCRSANNNTIIIPAELQSFAQLLGPAKGMTPVSA